MVLKKYTLAAAIFTFIYSLNLLASDPLLEDWMVDLIHQQELNSRVSLPNGDTYYSRGNMIWSVGKDKQLGTVDDDLLSINAALLPNGNLLASSTSVRQGMEKIRVRNLWRLTTDLRKLKAANVESRYIRLSPNKKKLLFIQDYHIKELNLDTLQVTTHVTQNEKFLIRSDSAQYISENLIVFSANKGKKRKKSFGIYSYNLATKKLTNHVQYKYQERKYYRDLRFIGDGYVIYRSYETYYDEDAEESFSKNQMMHHLRIEE